VTECGEHTAFLEIFEVAIRSGQNCAGAGGLLIELLLPEATASPVNQFRWSALYLTDTPACSPVPEARGKPGMLTAVGFKRMFKDVEQHRPFTGD
jgi:hypothetical protein